MHVCECDISFQIARVRKGDRHSDYSHTHNDDSNDMRRRRQIYHTQMVWRAFSLAAIVCVRVQWECIDGAQVPRIEFCVPFLWTKFVSIPLWCVCTDWRKPALLVGWHRFHCALHSYGWKFVSSYVSDDACVCMRARLCKRNKRWCVWVCLCHITVAIFWRACLRFWIEAHACVCASVWHRAKAVCVWVSVCYSLVWVNTMRDNQTSHSWFVRHFRIRWIVYRRLVNNSQSKTYWISDGIDIGRGYRCDQLTWWNSIESKIFLHKMSSRNPDEFRLTTANVIRRIRFYVNWSSHKFTLIRQRHLSFQWKFIFFIRRQ